MSRQYLVGFLVTFLASWFKQTLVVPTIDPKAPWPRAKAGHFHLFEYFVE